MNRGLSDFTNLEKILIRKEVYHSFFKFTIFESYNLSFLYDC